MQWELSERDEEYHERGVLKGPFPQGPACVSAGLRWVWDCYNWPKWEYSSCPMIA